MYWIKYGRTIVYL